MMIRAPVGSGSEIFRAERPDFFGAKIEIKKILGTHRDIVGIDLRVLVIKRIPTSGEVYQEFL